jgi:hypothetical protein
MRVKREEQGGSVKLEGRNGRKEVLLGERTRGETREKRVKGVP